MTESKDGLRKDFRDIAVHYLEHVGFRVIYAVKDNFYLLIPVDPAEEKEYGKAVFSPQAMERIGELLSKF